MSNEKKKEKREIRTQQRGEHHEETGAQIDVDRLDVRDLWQRRVRRRHQGGHGQHSGHAQTDSGGRGAAIQPERHPRDDDDQTGRDVDLNQVVAHRTHELNFARESAVVAGGERRLDRFLPVAQDLELRQRNVRRNLNRVEAVVPLVPNITHRVAD